jgi:hypothetical protein
MSSHILFSVDAFLARPVDLRQLLSLQELSDSEYAEYGGGALSSQQFPLGPLPPPLVSLEDLVKDVDDKDEHHDDDNAGGDGDEYDVEAEGESQERYAATLKTQEAAAARAAMIVGTTVEDSGAGTLTFNVYRVQKKGAASEDDFDTVSHPPATLKATDKTAYTKQLARWMNQHRKYTGVKATPRKRWTEKDNIIVLRAIKGARGTFGESRPAKGALGYQTHVDFWGPLGSAKEAQSVPEVRVCMQ